MNINQAYLQGLTDAENIVIEKLEAYLLGSDTTPFNNPELEEIRQRLLAIEYPTNNNKNESTIDNKFLSKLESSIKSEPDRRNWTNTEFQDERLNNLFKALTNTIDFCWTYSKNKHASGKAMKRILKESEEMITPNVDISETEIKS